MLNKAQPRDWAAMISEQGADTVYLSYRHAPPAFEPADWSWVNPLVDAIVANPDWFRHMTAEEKDQVNRRLWAEGRLKLEPWLAKRVTRDAIKLFPQSQVTACRELPNGELEVRMNGQTIEVDHFILATGYKVNVSQIPLLANGNRLTRLEIQDGYPHPR